MNWLTKQFKIFSLVGVLVFLGFGLVKTQAATGINQQINYQGKLSDSTGVQVSDDSWNFRFSLYDVSSGGSPIWTERWTSTSTQVTTVNGVFSTPLGTITGFATSTVDFSDDNLWLQIDLDADDNGSWEESFTTRKRFTSTPYAFNTDTLDGIHATSTAAVANYLLALDSVGDLNLFDRGVSSTNATTSVLYLQPKIVEPDGIEGRVYYNDTTNNIMVYNGASWQTVGSGGGAVWEYNAAWDALTPTSTKGIYVTASSTFASNLKVEGNATTTGHLAALGGNSDQWNLAFGWGNPSGVYVPTNWAGYSDNRFATLNATTTNVDTFHIYTDFTTDDTGLVTNLNSDLLDSQHGSYYSNWDNLTNRAATSTILSLLDSDYRLSVLNATTTNIDTLTVYNGATFSGLMTLNDARFPNGLNASSTSNFLNLLTYGNATTTGNTTLQNTLYVQDGKVGVATSSPSQTFSVEGGMLNSDSFSNGGYDYSSYISTNYFGTFMGLYPASYGLFSYSTSTDYELSNLLGTIGIYGEGKEWGVAGTGEYAGGYFLSPDGTNYVSLGSKIYDAGVYAIGNTYGVYAEGNTYGLYASGSTYGLYVSGDAYFMDDATTTQHMFVGELLTDNTNLVSNLNADFLDGQHGSYYSNWDNLTNRAATSTVLTLLDSDYRISVLNATTTNVDTLTVYNGATFNSVTTTDTLSVGGYASSTKLFVGIDGQTSTSTQLRGGLLVDTDTLVVNANENRVGIGTDSPTTLVETKGEYPIFTLRDNRSTTFTNQQEIAALQFISDDASGSLQGQVRSKIGFISDGTTGDTMGMTFWTRSGGTFTEKMRINGAGYVGIGDTSPLSLFTVGNGDKFQIDTVGNIITTGQARLPMLNATTTNIGTLTVYTSSTYNGLTTINDARFFNGLNASSTSNFLNLLTYDNATTTGNLTVSSTAGFGTAQPNDNIAINITTANNQGYGIYVNNLNTASESNYGVYASTTNSLIGQSVYGLYGLAKHTGSGLSYGVYGKSNGGSGTTNYGGYFDASVSGPAPLTNYGVYSNVSPGGGSAYAFYGAVADDASITAGYGVYIDQNDTGGAIPSYGIYVDSEATNAGGGLYIADGSVYMADLATGTNDNVCANSGLLYIDDDGDGCSDGTDLAELIPTDTDLEPGDVVVIDTSTNQQLKRSTQAYDPLAVGVVSTVPWMYMANQDEQDAGIPAEKIALVGRVPTKVSGENGPIAIGDYLTTSNTPGHAMKATESEVGVIGVALEPFSGTGTGRITILVKTGDNLPVEPSDQIVVANAPAGFNPDDLAVSQSATFYGTMYVVGEAGFEHKVVFKDDVEIEGKLYVSSDQAGTAVIKAGATSTEVLFGSDYALTPKITISPRSNPSTWSWVNNESASGFRINLGEAIPNDIEFNWIALAVKDTNIEPPVIASILVSPESVTSGNTIKLEVQADDPDSKNLTYTWSFEGLETDELDGRVVNWTTPGVDLETTVYVSVTVSDGKNEVIGSGVVKILPGETEVPVVVEEPEPIEEPTTTPELVIITGCTDQSAQNYDPEATEDDGSCLPTEVTAKTGTEEGEYSEPIVQDEPSGDDTIETSTIN